MVGQVYQEKNLQWQKLIALYTYLFELNSFKRFRIFVEIVSATDKHRKTWDLHVKWLTLYLIRVATAQL